MVFFSLLVLKSVKLLLGFLMKPGQMLVIDDGVEPRAFYQTATKLIPAAYRPEALPPEESL